jgi:hypothetical protein
MCLDGALTTCYNCKNLHLEKVFIIAKIYSKIVTIQLLTKQQRILKGTKSLLGIFRFFLNSLL